RPVSDGKRFYGTATHCTRCSRRRPEVGRMPLNIIIYRAMKKIEVESTSSHSAKCSDIVLRQRDQVRLVFRPEIVDNQSNPEARVKGTFIYQKKAKTDPWLKFDTVPLSSLKKGSGYQLTLHSDEVLTLRRELYDLARLHRERGIPHGHAEFVKVQS